MTAKIKLNAESGGGSFSIQAPSSSANNRVLTLPDSADGIVAQTDSSGNFTVSGNLKAGTITDTSGNNSSTTQQIFEGRAKIWVSFNGTNTALRDHFGVSSVTDEGTGDYSVNFSTAMSNTGYCSVYGSSNWETNNLDSYTTMSDNNDSGARTTGKLRIIAMRMRFDSSTPQFKDPVFCSVAIFGDQ